jgi:hypothetical protein
MRLKKIDNRDMKTLSIEAIDSLICQDSSYPHSMHFFDFQVVQDKTLKGMQ